MKISPYIFREFSIRGVADRDLTDDVVLAIGQAIGAFYKQRDKQTLVVGRDVRNSSPRISRALIAGLLEAGLDVTDVGVVPTPVHNFITDYYAADGGVMVTASHNPPEHNGLKIRTDHSLDGRELREIYHLAAEKLAKVSQVPPLDQYTRLKQTDPLPTYLAYIKSHARIQRPLKVVVDGGNGTNGLIASRLLHDLGCQVVQLYCEPDGNFPHRDPDPTAPGALSDLAARVEVEGAHLGLAYDGDGDRLALVWIPGKLDRKHGRTMEDYINISLRYLEETVLRMRKGDFSALPLEEQTCRNCSERPYCPYIHKTVMS